MLKNFDISVDTTKGVKNQEISVNTNDLQTLKFSIAITQSGVPVDLTGSTVRIAVRKPDKKTVFQDCIITDAVNGKCEVVLDTQSYIVPGLHPVELMIYYAADKVSVTGRFAYTANKGILDDGSIVSTNEFQSITKAIKDAEYLIEDIRENGTGIDVEARSGLETVTTQLADTGAQIEVLSNTGVNIESFPRIVPEVNDQGRFMRAHDSLLDGGNLFIPNKVYIVNSLIFTKTIHIIGSYGTIKLVDGATLSDYILSLKGHYSSVEGIWFDGNKVNTTNNTGRAEGLRIEGDYCVVRSCWSKDTINGGFAHTFVNLGKHNTFDKCVSFNAGYAGFSNNSGDYLTLQNCTAMNFRIKGFRHNGNGNLVVLDNCHFESNTSEVASDGILFDSGEGSMLSVARVSKCTVKGSIGSNSLKCEYVEKVFIENSDLLASGTTIYGINLQVAVKEATITNVKLNGYLRAVGDTDRLILKNVTIVTDSTKTENMSFSGKELIIDGLYLYGAQNGIRFEVLHASGKQNLIIDNIELTASAPTGKLFRPITFLGSDHITLKKYKILNGDTALFAGLTGASANDRQIQRAPRTFSANSIPTTGSFVAGDKVINYAPSVLGTVGSQYILDGWRRLTTGNTHVLNTDWVEQRILTGS